MLMTKLTKRSLPFLTHSVTRILKLVSQFCQQKTNLFCRTKDYELEILPLVFAVVVTELSRN